VHIANVAVKKAGAGCGACSQGFDETRGLLGNGEEIEACSETARHPLRMDELVAAKAHAHSRNCLLLGVNRNELEQMLVLNQLAEDDVESGETIRFNGHDLRASEWMMALLSTGVFRQLPATSIQQIFTRMRIRHVSAGFVWGKQTELPTEYSPWHKV